MRRTEEEGMWDKYDAAVASRTLTISVSDTEAIEFRKACTIIAGSNGSGKSRVLAAAAAQLGDAALLIELHHLTQLVLNATGSREDFDEMTEEFSPVGPDDARLSDLSRIIGRSYSAASWFSLDMELAEEFSPDRFLWGGEQAVLPYFVAQYRDVTYSSLHMGLGEFATHLLFWVLDQYRDTRDLVLLLDEPDAFLPPVAASALLARLLATCRTRGWRLVITTHSDDLIRRAVSRGALLVLGSDDGGAITAEYSDDDPNIAEFLLTRTPIENVLFCEDESAWALITELLRSEDRVLWRSTSIVWGQGHGYLRGLHTHLPQPPKPEMRFALVFDGDQRGTVTETPGQWPRVFLPTSADPDDMFKALRADPATLASEMSVDEVVLRRFLPMIEAEDGHDWVNKLGEEFGRAIVLKSLSALWVRQNKEEAGVFIRDLRAGW